MINYPLTVLIGLIVGGAITGVVYFLYIKPALDRIKSEKSDLASREEKLQKEIEAKRKEVLLEAKEEAFKIRAEIERENREKRAEIQRLERRLTQKEETLDRRLDNLDRKEKSHNSKRSRSIRKAAGS